MKRLRLLFTRLIHWAKFWPIGPNPFGSHEPFISDDPYYGWADARLDEMAEEARLAKLVKR